MAAGVLRLRAAGQRSAKMICQDKGAIDKQYAALPPHDNLGSRR
jgi:hypothetical protein